MTLLFQRSKKFILQLVMVVHILVALKEVVLEELHHLELIYQQMGEDAQVGLPEEEELHLLVVENYGVVVDVLMEKDHGEVVAVYTEAEVVEILEEDLAEDMEEVVVPDGEGVVLEVEDIMEAEEVEQEDLIIQVVLEEEVDIGIIMEIGSILVWVVMDGIMAIALVMENMEPIQLDGLM